MSLRIPLNLLHLRRSQGRTLERLRRSQLSLLRRLVAAAQRDVPFYRDLYDSHGLSARSITDPGAFARFPIVTKGDIKANFPDRIVSRRFEARSLYAVATSGTSDRVMSFQDETKRDWDRAADLLMALQCDGVGPHRRRAVIPPDACYERCGADEHGRTQTAAAELRELVHNTSGSRTRTARRLVSLLARDHFWRLEMLRSLGVDGTAAAPALLDGYLGRMAEQRPHMLQALPMYLFILARHVQRTGRTLELAKIIRPSGGKLTSEMIRVVETALGGRCRENYGMAELGTVAFDCPLDRRQHLLSELFYIEFVRAGRPVAPGEVGEILITDLRNRAAPLIRYAIGDVGCYDDRPCRCGRAGLLFSVAGRLDETVVTPAGLAAPGDELIDALLRRPDIAFARLVQQADDLFLAEIVPDRSDDMPAADALSESLSRLLRRPVQVRPRAVQGIRPEGSGKYRLVVSSSWRRFHTAVECVQ